jgi:hypothetical protein
VGRSGNSWLPLIVGAAAVVVVVGLIILVALWLRVRRHRSNRNDSIRLGSRTNTTGSFRSADTGAAPAAAAPGIRRTSSRSVHRQRPTGEYVTMPRRPASPPPNSYATGTLGGYMYASGTFGSPQQYNSQPPPSSTVTKTHAYNLGTMSP